MKKFRLRGRRRKARAEKRDRIPARAIVPNLITSLAVCAGITSITLAAQNYALTLSGVLVTPRQWLWSVVALLIACICDGIDGRVARLLKSSSKLGAELDSLADFVNFGVAPALFLYFWVSSTLPIETSRFTRNLLLAFALYYSLCDAFRLARFNTMLEKPTLPYWKHFFTGVPAPGGCWMVVVPACYYLSLAQHGADVESLAWLRSPWLVSFMLFFVGSLMASTLPTISLKSVRISRRYLMPTMAGLLLLIAFLVANLWLTMAVAGTAYMFSVPLTLWLFTRSRDRYLRGQTRQEGTVEEA